MVILRRGHGRITVGPHQVRAVAIALILSVAGLLAALGREAERPRAAKLPFVGMIGPGRIGQLRGLELDSEGKAPKGIDAVARRALSGAPLAFEPFFGVAAAAFRGPQQVGTKQDAALLREALRRNPRSRESRLMLMRHAVGTGDLKGAIDELTVLNRLNGGAIEQLMVGLGSAISSERQIDEAVAALKPHPELYRPFVRGFRQAKKPGALAVRLVPQLPPAALADRQVRSDAIQLMIDAQAFAQARKLWGVGLAAKPGELVFSPDFADSKAPPPFNWELTENSTGVAERVAGAGISARYYGRTPGPLARQLLTLGPGAYTASVDYRTTDGVPGIMALQIRCTGSNLLLGERLLDGKLGAERVTSLGFTVPDAACSGQTINLAGRPAETRDPQEVAVRSITLKPGGGQ
jgi:hypothetical protein